jgi:hypothetical protein
MKKTLRPWESYDDEVHVPGNLFSHDLHFQITTRTTPRLEKKQESETVNEDTIMTSLEKAKKILDNR